MQWVGHSCWSLPFATEANTPNEDPAWINPALQKEANPLPPKTPPPVTHFLDILRLLNQIQPLRPPQALTEERRRGKGQTRGKQTAHDRRHARLHQKLSGLGTGTPHTKQTGTPTAPATEVAVLLLPHDQPLTIRRFRSVQTTGQPPSINPGCFPRDYRQDSVRLACAVNPPLRFGYGPSALDSAALAAYLAGRSRGRILIGPSTVQTPVRDLIHAQCMRLTRLMANAKRDYP